MIHEQYNRTALPEQLAGMWRRRKWLLIITFFAVFPAGVALVLALPPLYRSSTTLLLGEGDISTALIRAGTNEGISARLDVINKVILSRSRLQDLVERFDLYPQLRGQPVQVIVARARADIGIRQEAVATQTWEKEPTITLTLSYQSQDPQLAATIANELANMYGQENENLLQHRSTRTAEFLRTQLDDASARLTRQEKLIRDFRNEHLRELPEQQSLSLATLDRLNAEFRLLGEKQIQLMNRRDALLIGGNALGLLSGSGSQFASAARESGLSELEVRRLELNDLRGRYTDRHPEVIRLQNEVARLEALPGATRGGASSAPAPDSAANAVRRPELDTIAQELSDLNAQQDELRTTIGELQERLESSPGLTQELLQLNQDYATIREQHLSLQRLYEEARLDESMELEQNRRFQVLEPAIPSMAPAAPNRFRLIVMGFILSVGFACGLVVLREHFDTSFHTLQDLRAFTRLPVLGSIARIETTRDKFRHGFRSMALGVGMTAGIVVLVVLAYNVGESGEKLVWMLAGRAI
jgi:polysaccharide chain length determinant protein (PEP-CTERM system associated)